MILPLSKLCVSKYSITRTCGGDPAQIVGEGEQKLVLPAHAGVILNQYGSRKATERITRTCEGDPSFKFNEFFFLMYYPHMRG